MIAQIKKDTGMPLVEVLKTSINIGLTYPLDANLIAKELGDATKGGTTSVEVTFFESRGDEGSHRRPLSFEDAEALSRILMTIPCVSLWRVVKFEGLDHPQHTKLLATMQKQRRDVVLT